MLDAVPTFPPKRWTTYFLMTPYTIKTKLPLPARNEIISIMTYFCFVLDNRRRNRGRNQFFASNFVCLYFHLKTCCFTTFGHFTEFYSNQSYGEEKQAES